MLNTIKRYINLNSLFFLLFGSLIISAHFTTLRNSAFGPIEILLFIFSSYLYIKNVFIRGRTVPIVILIPIIFLITFITPITILNIAQGFFGSSILTTLALIFANYVSICLWFLDDSELEALGIGMFLTIFISLAISIFSGQILEELVRFAFLAENPNQLALYALVGACISSITIKDYKFKLFSIFIMLLYGIVSLSDSLFLAIFVGMMYFIFCQAFKRRMLGIIMLTFVILTSYALLNFDLDPLGFLSDLWFSADQGGGRVKLAINGLIAYLNSPLFGHGGGAFSGTYNPFGRFEAHNTIIDLLTIGGPLLVLFFYYPLVKGVIALTRNNRFLESSLLVSVVLYSVFHFVARHPILWVLIFISFKLHHNYKKNVRNTRSI